MDKSNIVLGDIFLNHFDEADNRHRSSFALQCISDQLAAAENMPLRVVDIERLDSLGDIAQGLSTDQSLKKLYWDIYERKLDVDYDDYLSGEKINETANELVEYACKLFDHISDTINDSFRDYEENNPVFYGNDDEAINAIENGITKSIVDGITNYIADHKDQSFILLKLKDDKRIKILQFLLPYIEKQIWLTDNSYSVPIHILMRTDELWRLLVLLWIYCKRKQVKLASTSPKKTKRLDNAFGIPFTHLEIINIGRIDKFYCFVGPFVEPIDDESSYSFYCKKGIYLKYCFLSYLYALAEDYADRPSAEEINGMMIRRLAPRYDVRDAHITNIKNAWHIILTTVIERKTFSVLSHKNFCDLGLLAGFFSHYDYRFYDNAKRVRGDRTFIVNKVVESNINNEKSVVCRATINEDKVRININTYQNYEGSSESDKLLDIKLRMSKLSIRRKKQEHFIRHINRKYLKYTEATGLRVRTFHGSCVDVLAEWLQRHYGADEKRHYGSVQKGHEEDFYSDIARNACRTLSEITRADICTTIYKIDHRDSKNRLVIVGDYSHNPDILISKESRQQSMDDALKGGAANSIAYKCISKNRFLYEPQLDNNKAIIDAYPEPKPHSAMVMPLYMEHRLLGIIEVKGSQFKHFRWSLRVLLHQIASVLAPYFYRQQVIQSLTKVSRYVLAGREHAYTLDVDGFASSPAFEKICNELCNIFLCESAHLWLSGATKPYKFYLKGVTDNRIYSHTTLDNSGQISIKVIASENGSKEPSHLVDYLKYIKQQPLCISDPGQFILGVFNDVNKKTRFDEHRNIVHLSDDYLESDKYGVRNYLINICNYSEMLAFALTWNSGNGHVVKGYVTLHSNNIFGYSKNWSHTITLVHDQLVMSLLQLQYFQDEISNNKLLAQHEIKQQTKKVTEKANTFAGRIQYLTNNIGYISEIIDFISNEEHASVLEKLNKQVSKPSYRYENMKNKDIVIATQKALTELNKDASELHGLINRLSNRPSIETICKYDENSAPVRIYLREFINEVMSSYRHRFNTCGIVPDNTIYSNIFWKTYSDPFYRIMINLLDNASKYSADNSVIEINGDVSSFSISNKSNYAEDLDSKDIFKIKVRGSNALHMPGDGYGLYISKECCKLLSIDISYKQVRDKKRVELATHTFTLKHKG